MRTWAFDVWESWAQKTFLFREPEFDPVPELMISRQKIGLMVIVSGEGSTVSLWESEVKFMFKC